MAISQGLMLLCGIASAEMDAVSIDMLLGLTALIYERPFGPK
jgi:hypothetical protein